MDIKILIENDLNGNKPKWCKHINFWSRAATILDGMEFDAQGGWNYKTAEAPCGLTANKWNYCPICGIKRP